MSLPPDVDLGPALQASTWSTTAVAFVFVVLRFWARLYKRSIAIDDWIMLSSWVLLLACSIIFHFVATSGGTRRMEYLTTAEIEYQLKLTIINLPIAFTVTALGRIAIGVTILRIVGNTSPRKKWAIWAVLGLLVTASIIDIFLGLFRCGAPQIQWDLARLATAECISSTAFNNFNFFTLAVQAFSDYFFSVLPMMVVWKLNMEMRPKLTIVFLLSLTLVTGAVGTAKLAYMIRMSTSELTGRVFEVAVLFSFEAMFIIVFGSMPVLKPLWELCVDVKQSRKRSRQTRWSKETAPRSSNKDFIVQGSNGVTPPQELKLLPTSNTELERFSSHPEEPAVFVYGGGEFNGYPQQPAVFVHQGEVFTGYPQPSAEEAKVIYGGQLTGYSQQTPVIIHGGEGFQDESLLSNQMPENIHVQHQIYQNITPQHGMHGTYRY